MPRTLLKVFGGWWVVVVLDSEFSVHLWSEALAKVWTKLNKKAPICTTILKISLNRVKINRLQPKIHCETIHERPLIWVIK